MYKTDNAPIRLSYHQNNHYNSVVDPFTATVGVGLGLAGHKPGVSVIKFITALHFVTINSMLISYI